VFSVAAVAVYAPFTVDGATVPEDGVPDSAAELSMVIVVLVDAVTLATMALSEVAVPTVPKVTFAPTGIVLLVTPITHAPELPEIATELSDSAVAPL
jgi:hypothetical protein